MSPRTTHFTIPTKSLRLAAATLAAAGSFLLLSLPASASNVAAGALDPSYGPGGSDSTAASTIDPTASHPSAGDNVVGAAVATQSDGKIVVVSTAEQGPTAQASQQALVVTRFDTDGSLDTTFGTDGSFVLPTAAGESTIGSAVVVQANGDIVIGGELVQNVNSATLPGAFNSLLVRLTPSGALDQTFGSGGQVVGPTGYSFADQFNGLALQSNGDIVAVGDNDNGWQVERFTSAGALDHSFGSSGQVDFDPSNPASFFDNAQAVAIAPDGDILVAGSANSVTGFGLAELTSTGAFNPSFGSGGQVITNPGNSSETSALGLAVQTDGDIVVGGYTTPGGAVGQLAVQQFNSSGALLATKLVSRPSETLNGGELILQPDNSVILAGYETETTTQPEVADAIVTARLTPSLALDTTFGSGGVGVAPISTDNEVFGIAAEPTSVDDGLGSFVVAGADETASTNYGLLTARFVEQAESGPTVTSQPTDQSVTTGATATFTAAASGVPSSTVQWQVSTNGGTTFSAIPGATSDTLTFAATTSETGNLYRAVFTSPVGSATTRGAKLTVTPAVALPEAPWPALLIVGPLIVVGYLVHRSRRTAL